MKVQWSSDLETGVGIIDDQHRKLVDRISDFVDAVAENNNEDIEETVNYLIGYTIQHFGAEELIMIRHGYVDFKNHRDEHTRFIKMVYDAKKSLISDNLSIQQIENLRDELVDWAINHIKVMDKDIAKHIKI
ncbi:hypothetical protein BHU72_02060 [Desulfuribacillus stibiiarsenatis]|uniref:Hemerythrin-like domain-containing protein n=1 Tax=Desulfuribacillus stibiiarsenatis TaxID=1390249 RepID=A0A1E5L668_9FIRM|nr:bacteriohemerythrin [Desulfuribacillus stibiiarsenatis]OEH85606.1 hypothetical protein BHU72_02060 [Desulfuribacillus stibiiarsenatis]